MRWLLIALSCLSAFGMMVSVPTAPAGACSCADSERLDRFDRAAVAFYGRAYSQDRALRERFPSHSENASPTLVDHTRFTVDRVWKGTPGDQIEVITPYSMCVTSFDVGREYIVWADRIRGDGRLRAAVGTACSGDSRPGPVATGQEDYDFLEQQRAAHIAAGYAAGGPREPQPRVRVIAGRAVQFPGDAYVFGYFRSWDPTNDSRPLLMIVERGQSSAQVNMDTGTFTEQTAAGKPGAFDFLREAFR